MARAAEAITSPPMHPRAPDACGPFGAQCEKLGTCRACGCGDSRSFRSVAPRRMTARRGLRDEAAPGDRRAGGPHATRLPPLPRSPSSDPRGRARSSPPRGGHPAEGRVGIARGHCRRGAHARGAPKASPAAPARARTRRRSDGSGAMLGCVSGGLPGGLFYSLRLPGGRCRLHLGPLPPPGRNGYGSRTSRAFVCARPRRG